MATATKPIDDESALIERFRRDFHDLSELAQRNPAAADLIEECQRTGRGHDRLLIASEALEDAVDAVLAAEMPAPKELDQ